MNVPKLQENKQTNKQTVEHAVLADNNSTAAYTFPALIYFYPFINQNQDSYSHLN